MSGIEQEKNQPFQLALRTLPPLIYGADHAYGIPFTGSGTKGSIQAIAAGDLLDFHRRWLRPDNAIITVVGDVKMDEILPQLEKAFGGWKVPREPLAQKSITQVALPDAGRVIIIDRPDAPQSMILAAHVAPPSGVENNIAITMMNHILGGQYLARVNQNLRVDKHWTYGAYTLLQDARAQRPWIVYAPVQTDQTAAAIAELVQEFQRYRTTAPATADELLRTMRKKSYSLPGQFETGQAVLSALQDNQRFGRPDDYIQTLKQRYENVNLEDIQAAAEQVLQPDKLIWVVVGDRRQIEQAIRELDIGDVEIMDMDGNLVKD